MRDLYSELKRRNVIKVAIAYAIVAWLLIQIVVSVEAPLRLPDWVDSVTIVLLGVGFPVALVMAWALELTPDGIRLSPSGENPQESAKPTRRTLNIVIVAALGLVVVILLVDRFIPRINDPVTGASLAVLPFTDLSPLGDQEYFSDGIAEELLNSLTGIPGLRVAGRTSSFSFKGGDEDLRVIGDRLGVANILEGSVRKIDDRVRIAVQLVQASSGFQVWSASYDRDLTDIFAIQEEIARSVADALSIALDVGERRFGSIGTRNLEAYDTALKGRAAMLRPAPESSERAIAQFRKSVSLDPDYAYAWSLLSAAYVEAGSVWYSERASEYFERAYEAATRAVQASPDSPDALRAMGVVQTRRFQWPEAELNFARALEISPMDEFSNLTYCWFLINVGRPEEALRYGQRAAGIDPLAISPALQLFMAHRALGDVARSMSMYEQLLAMSEDNLLVLGTGLTFAMELNDSAKIEEQFDAILSLSGLPPSQRSLTSAIKDVIGQPDEARRLLLGYAADPRYQSPLDQSIIAVYASYFGEHELAARIFLALQSTGALAGELLWRPIHAGMRRLPGFEELLRERGLITYWRQSGNWGDMCRPVGDNDFECR